jgi:hypothetical protein
MPKSRSTADDGGGAEPKQGDTTSPGPSYSVFSTFAKDVSTDLATNFIALDGLRHLNGNDQCAALQKLVEVVVEQIPDQCRGALGYEITDFWRTKIEITLLEPLATRCKNIFPAAPGPDDLTFATFKASDTPLTTYIQHVIDMIPKDQDYVTHRNRPIPVIDAFMYQLLPTLRGTDFAKSIAAIDDFKITATKTLQPAFLATDTSVGISILDHQFASPAWGFIDTIMSRHYVLNQTYRKEKELARSNAKEFNTLAGLLNTITQICRGELVGQEQGKPQRQPPPNSGSRPRPAAPETPPPKPSTAPSASPQTGATAPQNQPGGSQSQSANPPTSKWTKVEILIEQDVSKGQGRAFIGTGLLDGVPSKIFIPGRNVHDNNNEGFTKLRPRDSIIGTVTREQLTKTGETPFVVQQATLVPRNGANFGGMGSRRSLRLQPAHPVPTPGIATKPIPIPVPIPVLASPPSVLAPQAPATTPQQQEPAASTPSAAETNPPAQSSPTSPTAPQSSLPAHVSSSWSTITVRPPSGPMTKLRVIFDSGLESALATGNKAILHNWTLPGPEVSLVAANKKPMSVHGTGTAILRLPDHTEVSVQGALLCNEIAEDLIYIGLPTMAMLSRLLGNKGGVTSFHPDGSIRAAGLPLNTISDAARTKYVEQTMAFQHNIKIVEPPPMIRPTPPTITPALHLRYPTAERTPHPPNRGEPRYQPAQQGNYPPWTHGPPWLAPSLPPWYPSFGPAPLLHPHFGYGLPPPVFPRGWTPTMAPLHAATGNQDFRKAPLLPTPNGPTAQGSSTPLNASRC